MDVTDLNLFLTPTGFYNVLSLDLLVLQFLQFLLLLLTISLDSLCSLFTLFLQASHIPWGPCFLWIVKIEWRCLFGLTRMVKCWKQMAEFSESFTFIDRKGIQLSVLTCPKPLAKTKKQQFFGGRPDERNRPPLFLSFDSFCHQDIQTICHSVKQQYPEWFFCLFSHGPILLTSCLESKSGLSPLLFDVLLYKSLLIPTWAFLPTDIALISLAK